MGLFTYEIVFLDIPFTKMLRTRNKDLKFQHVIYISAGSMTLLKSFQRGHWPRWNRLSKRLSRRIRSHIETGLACLSGTYKGLMDEKTESRKSRDTVPLSNYFYKIKLSLIPILLCVNKSARKNSNDPWGNLTKRYLRKTKCCFK
jgi:hypothetical protein